MTLSIVTLSIMTLRIITHSIVMLSMMTDDTHHYDIQYNDI